MYVRRKSVNCQISEINETDCGWQKQGEINECLAKEWEGEERERDSRSISVSLCSSALSGASCLLSLNQFPWRPQPVPRVPGIISDIHVRKRRSSRVSSFAALKIEKPNKKGPIDARGCIRGYFWQSWLFFLASPLPTDNICVNSRPVLL